MDLILNNLNLIIFVALVFVGYFAGSSAERRHYASIVEREKETVRFPVVTAEARFADGRVREAFMVSGSVVISMDYFKRLLGNLRNLFGGRIRAYESLIDRARREAILRMKEDAQARGGEMITNLRMETSTLTGAANRQGQIGSVEVIAYGTAVVFNPK
jgi:uncharacterized protein YbjQ (UPF0145 family)